MKTPTPTSLALVLSLAGGAAAQDARTARAVTPLQVQVVIARKQAGRDVARLPYLLTCNADDDRASLRMGIEVPVPVGGEKKFQYRNVGMNIDCRAKTLPDGLFRFEIQLEQSSLPDIGPGRAPRRTTADAAGGVDPDLPLFRTFNSSFNAVLRDGQTALQTAATDPVSGEEVTIELTAKAPK